MEILSLVMTLLFILMDVLVMDLLALSRRQTAVQTANGSLSMSIESAGKVMASVFWGTKGIVLINHLEKAGCQNSREEAGLRVKKKKEAFTRTAQYSQKYRQWETAGFDPRFACPFPYYLDLVPADFHLCPHLKKFVSESVSRPIKKLRGLYRNILTVFQTQFPGRNTDIGETLDQFTGTLSISTVKKWAAEFKRGRTLLDDDPRK
ncbi:hypothetical protein LAZ67_7001711 [Cordylochernes scorpioides]|uniref:Uncharacterized protein n=1 Tax=Cordylochernes scorpioides TaxID=51811 RepID=A0ABY6KNG0_9ARAC|nr:hypothetical protein LAZ67_7001711 [Cordylochernes scorpioides]